MKRIDGSSVFMLTLLLSGGALIVGPLCPRARAESTVEVSGASGFGVLAAGVAPGRFAVSPSASVAFRGERGFFVVRDTASFLGPSGASRGRFGINNETTVGGGVFWEQVHASAGLSLEAYSLTICGSGHCAQVHGVAPAASARVDIFGTCRRP